MRGQFRGDTRGLFDEIIQPISLYLVIFTASFRNKKAKLNFQPNRIDLGQI